MANKFISSDYHFYHNNIIKYCNRPFSNVNEMNDVIIRKHNERVTEKDTMFFLGDFAYYASKNRAFRGEGQPYNFDSILDKMNGKFWNFVKGNHDKPGNKSKIITESIIVKQNKTRIQMVHDPLYAKIDYDLILCGHVHNNWKLRELHYCGQKRLIINCSCDVWNFYPIRIDEILSIYNKWKYQISKTDKWKTPSIIKEMNKNYE